jgi:hypothetical protein
MGDGAYRQVTSVTSHSTKTVTPFINLMILDEGKRRVHCAGSLGTYVIQAGTHYIVSDEQRLWKQAF